MNSPRAGHLAAGQRRKHGDTAPYMPVIRSRMGMPTFCGPPPGRLSASPVTRHQAAHGLNEKIISNLLRQRSGLAEARDRAIDQPRIDLREVVVAEPVTRERAHLEILQNNVGVRRQLAHHRLTFGLVDVERERALAAVDRGNSQTLAVSLPSLAFRNGGPQPRVSSPAPGRSTLITSAPKSASIWPTHGPAMTAAEVENLDV